MAVPLVPLLGLVASVAPTLIGYVRGERAGELAEEIVDVAADVAGLSGSADVQAIGRAIEASRERQGALRLRLIEIEDRERAREIQDRADARAREATLRAEGTFDPVPAALVLVAFAAVAGGMWIVATEEVDEARLALMSSVIALFLKVLSDIYAYYFGSSRGSKAKQADIGRLVDAVVQVGAMPADVAARPPEARRAAALAPIAPSPPLGLVERLRRGLV